MAVQMTAVCSGTVLAGSPAGCPPSPAHMAPSSFTLSGNLPGASLEDAFIFLQITGVCAQLENLLAKRK